MIRTGIVRTPAAAKGYAAMIRDRDRILFLWPVDSEDEGQARIDDGLALLDGLKRETGEAAGGARPRQETRDWSPCPHS